MSEPWLHPHIIDKSGHWEVRRTSNGRAGTSGETMEPPEGDGWEPVGYALAKVYYAHGFGETDDWRVCWRRWVEDE